MKLSSTSTVAATSLNSADFRLRVRALAQLEAVLALPVDLVVKDARNRARPIHRIARLAGEPLS